MNLTPNSSANALTFTEEGAAYAELAVQRQRVQSPDGGAERFDVVVIGAGQAGLSVGYHLRHHGHRFVILDGNARVGDSWRHRWDSLRLFTPARFDALDGMPFPAPPHYFPTKDEMGDYLERYARSMELPVRTGERVVSLTRRGDEYHVRTNRGAYVAQQVVVAMASYQRRKVPAFATALRTDIVQLHSSEYQNPAQLADGPVLIVGAGNSGAEIARELLAQGRSVWLSGRDTGALPFRIDGWLGRALLVWLVLRVVFHRLLTVRTPVGRRARAAILHQGGPLIRVKTPDLVAAGVQRVPRVTGTRDGLPELEDGRVLDAANVIFCTGFHPGFSWIDLPIFDEHGDPAHVEGVATDEPGLYFVGLHFQFSLSSTMVHGVGRDARHIVNVLTNRHRPARSERRAAAA